MLRVIEAKSQVKKAQREFEKAMKAWAEKKGTITIGGPGFHGPREVSWSDRLKIWWTTYLVDNRFENAFGVQEPKWGMRYGHSIPCVIDVPLEGINRRIGGAFAVDEDNSVYLMHRGRIGGGKSGVGKTLFVNNYRGIWNAVRDGAVVSRLALVAEIGSENFPYQIAHYVHEVQRMKKEANEAEPEIPLPSIFKEEFSGRKKYSVREFEAECNHGLVVGELERELRLMGRITGNKYPMDLYVLDSNRQITVLFEIKTDSTSTSYYEAVGQLLFYSAKITKRPQLVAVFPDPIDTQCIDVFKRIGLQSLTYKWVKNEPSFDKHQIAEVATE